MFRMDVIKRIKDSGFVLLGADVEDVKRELSYLDLKRSLTDMEYMNFVKESLLMQDEAWGRFRYEYAESRIFAFVDGHIWIKAKVYEEENVLEEYKKLEEVDEKWKYIDVLDEV